MKDKQLNLLIAASVSSSPEKRHFEHSAAGEPPGVDVIHRFSACDNILAKAAAVGAGCNADRDLLRPLDVYLRRENGLRIIVESNQASRAVSERSKP
ncbi:hypothetical protein NLM25_07505 [Bradyrhizobium sp. CCGB01]|nr:hypothetical protein [Bradyrhizobium sp. CCGB01]MCP3405455.1 hypothetical protein [Bradyrhizobium sp. CCGB01]